MTLSDLIFVGFNKRVAAMDRHTGQVIWDWKAPKGSMYVTLLLDGDQLIVSVNGYMYALRAMTGEQLWMNTMSGFGSGVTCLTSERGNSSSHLLAAAAANAAAAVAASTNGAAAA
jgi:outer membrane protein assembly factor BamB